MYEHARVCVCARECVRECVCVCKCVYVCVCANVRMGCVCASDASVLYVYILQLLGHKWIDCKLHLPFVCTLFSVSAEKDTLLKTFQNHLCREEEVAV